MSQSPNPSAATDATDAPITILDFWAEWCGVCRLIDPVVQRIAGARANVTLEKHDIGSDQTLADQHQVKGLPTLIFLAADGRELDRLTGTITGKQIETTLTACQAKT